MSSELGGIDDDTMLCRLVDPKKWIRPDWAENAESSTIYNCLRTTRHALSLWDCDPEDAALALAFARNQFDPLTIARVQASDLTQRGIAIERTISSTPVTHLRARHVDIVRLTHRSLSSVGDALGPIVVDEKNGPLITYTAQNIEEMMQRAIHDGKVGKKRVGKIWRDRFWR